MKTLTIFLVSLIIILVGTLGFIIGHQSQNTANILPPLSAIPTPTPSSNLTACTMEAKLCPDGSSVGRTPPNCDFAPCPATTTQTISGGGILSFPKYSLQIPASWESTIIPGKDGQTVTVKNGKYSISITQGGFGGSICLYPGDPDSDGPSGRYTSFIPITTKSGDQLRRSIPQTGSGFGICQLTQYGWEAPTLYGHILFASPPNPDQNTLTIMDGILSSLTKK